MQLPQNKAAIVQVKNEKISRNMKEHAHYLQEKETKIYHLNLIISQ
jgi:hypothetical protein